MLLIDIDGVISLWGWPRAAPPDGAWTLVDGIPHFLASGPAARLQALTEAFEAVWCSGWEEKADEYLPRLVGLGPFGHLHFARPMAGAASPAHWKLAAIEAHAGPDRPLAWVDDQFNEACHEWARSRTGPTLLVETQPELGLTEEHRVELRTWAARLRQQ